MGGRELEHEDPLTQAYFLAHVVASLGCPFQLEYPAAQELQHRLDFPYLASLVRCPPQESAAFAFGIALNLLAFLSLPAIN